MTRQGVASSDAVAAQTSTERAVRPPVVELDGDDTSLGQVEGTMTLVWAESGNEAIEAFDEALATGSMDQELYDQIAESIEGRLDEAVASDAVADFVYHGVEMVSDVSLDAVDPFGATVVSYEGGSLDPSAFEVREHADGLDYEYRVIVIPPTLDEAEADAAQFVPSDDESALVPAPSKAAPGLAIAFAAGVLAGAAVAGSGSANLSTDQLDSSAQDPDAGASVEDLIAARSNADA